MITVSRAGFRKRGMRSIKLLQSKKQRMVLNWYKPDSMHNTGEKALVFLNMTPDL